MTIPWLLERAVHQPALRATTALMRQLMREQFASGGAVERRLLSAENNISTNRVREGVYPTSRFRRRRVRMQTHATKIMSEARLHECAG